MLLLASKVQDETAIGFAWLALERGRRRAHVGTASRFLSGLGISGSTLAHIRGREASGG
jgi:hypothetical protein